MNPWNITPKQAEALDAILANDGSKRAARSLGISEQAINDRAKLARRKMGLSGHIKHLIRWHDWRNHGIVA